MREYSESCKTDFWKNVFEREADYILKALGGSEDKPILSIGCGPAAIEGMLYESGFTNITGIDISEEMLRELPAGVKKIKGSAERMNIPDSSFDAAICVSSLQFIEDYEKAICETARVLRPNGKILVMLLNPESGFFKEKMEQRGSYVRQIKHLNIAEIEKEIFNYFEPVKKEYYLGIREREVFPSDDPNSSCLYIIQGKKK